MWGFLLPSFHRLLSLPASRVSPSPDNKPIVLGGLHVSEPRALSGLVGQGDGRGWAETGLGEGARTKSEEKGW